MRWLGWAGVELEAEGQTLVLDPLGDPGATFAGFGAAADAVVLPEVAPAQEGRAVAGLVTHLHRDHADAAALRAALADGAAVHHPASVEDANLALAQAEHELAASGLPRTEVVPWQTTTAGPFSFTAVPAVDGLGDPQVSWVVQAEGRRVLHLGDTMFHGAWWQLARRAGPFDVVLVPINGAAVDFPHQQPPSPLPAALDPEQAALAAELLGARAVVTIHHGGYALEPHYRPVEDAQGRFVRAAAGRPYRVLLPSPGEAV